jgi:hypothetical protein
MAPDRTAKEPSAQHHLSALYRRTTLPRIKHSFGRWLAASRILIHSELVSNTVTACLPISLSCRLQKSPTEIGNSGSVF